MTESANSLEAILWPSKYFYHALTRSSSFPEALTKLKHLYQFTFDPAHFLGDCEPLALPYSKALNLTQYKKYLAQPEPNLPLSIITVTRNDNHVERMQERTQAFIDSIYLLAERYQTHVELLIVDWNPPEQARALKDQFTFKQQHPYVSALIVQVPGSIHRQYNLADSLPLYQMIGKNVAIRRARGEFILSTNIDVLLSDELFQYITGPDMQAGKLYRSNRWDIDRKVLDLDTVADMLDQAKELCFQINYADGTRPKSVRHHERNEILLNSYLAISILHTWACGDFQLLHRDDWARLSGFSELDAFSFHIDSLFSITCHYAGIEEVALSDAYPHYHIDHGVGKSIKSNSYMTKRKKTLYHIAYQTLLQCDYQMKRQNDYFVFNNANWGLAGYDLPTLQLTTADWEKAQIKYQTPDQYEQKPSSIPTAAYFEELEKKQIYYYKRFIDMAYQQTSQYLESMAANTHFFIWGIGERGKFHAAQLIAKGIQITGFIHGLDTEYPDSLNNLPVYKPEAISIGPGTLILIASIFAHDIIDRLKTMGAEEGFDYILLI